MQLARRLHRTILKRACSEASDLVCWQNIRWHGRSFASSVPSDSPEVKKDRKRVSKQERKAMVESFVTKYGALNRGKFPSASEAKKQVGGSYYVIREILQELKYEATVSPMNMMNKASLENELARKCVLSAVTEQSSTQIADDLEVGIDAQAASIINLNISDSCLKLLVEKEKQQTSVLVERKSMEVGAGPSKTIADFKYVAGQQNDVEVENLYGETLILDDPKTKSEQYQRVPDFEKPESCETFVEKEEKHPSIFIKETSSAQVTELPRTCAESKYVVAQSHEVYKETKEVLNSCLGKTKYDGTEKMPPEAMLTFDPPKPKVKQPQEISFDVAEPKAERRQHSPELEKSEREVQEKSYIWENLKSLADGIIKVWRKL